MEHYVYDHFLVLHSNQTVAYFISKKTNIYMIYFIQCNLSLITPVLLLIGISQANDILFDFEKYYMTWLVTPL